MNENKIYNAALFTEADFKAARASWRLDLCGDEVTNDLSNPAVADLIRMRDEDSELLRREMNRDKSAPKLFGEGIPTASGELKPQYDRLFRLALPFSTVGCRAYHSKELLSDIIFGLDLLYDKMFGENVVSDTSFRSWKEYDWWDWYVGAACPLMDTLMIIEDYISPQEIARYITPVAFLRFKMRTAPTLAEAMSRVVTLTPLALLGEDRELLQTLFEECEMLLENHDSGDNMRRDYCCMTHCLPYNVAYGLINLSRIGKVAQILSRSPLAYPLKNLENLKEMLRYCFAPVMYRGRTLAPMNGRMMQDDDCAASILREVHYLYGLFGKDFDEEISRLIHSHDTPTIRRELISSYGNGMTLQEYRNINSIKGTRVEESPKTHIYSFNRFYDALNNGKYATAPEEYAYMWYSGDICVQHRHSSMIGLRMPSRRSIAYESMNGKHGDGWYTGDGALYLYTPTGMDEFSPSWWQGLDKAMIPGTTVEDRERKIMFFNCGWRPNRDFVGGVCLDGKYLTASMDYESFYNEFDEGRPDTGAGRSLPVYNCTLTANKSYFFFDKAILCLGSDISSKDGYTVRTTVENRVLEGENIIADGTEIPYAEGEISLSAKRIFIPHAGGFIFPNGGNIKVKFYEKATLRYASVYFDHGVDPEGGKYAYIILPNATAEETVAYDLNDIEILRNDGEIQAARESSSALCGIVFRKDCEFEGIKADQAMIAMLKNDENGNISSLSVCDPTQIRASYSFSAKCDRPLDSTDVSAEAIYQSNLFSVNIKCDTARGRAYRFFK